MTRIFLCLALSLATLATTFAQEAEIDTKKSNVEWSGTKVVGGGHNGVIRIKDGTIGLQNHVMESVNITIDMNTIKCTDLTDGGAANLEGHLNSADFFDVEKYGTATFKSTAVKATKAGYIVTGDLTIKDKTESADITVNADMHGQVIHASGKLTFDRTKFGVMYNSSSLLDIAKDKVISDEIELDFNIVTKM